jgi:hypothetical protein
MTNIAKVAENYKQPSQILIASKKKPIHAGKAKQVAKRPKIRIIRFPKGQLTCPWG